MENNLSIVKDKFKELPNNIEAEQAVIGSILVTKEIFEDVNTIVSSINFYDPMHQKIFGAIECLIFKGMLANPITLINYFENSISLAQLRIYYKTLKKQTYLLSKFLLSTNSL